MEVPDLAEQEAVVRQAPGVPSAMVQAELRAARVWRLRRRMVKRVETEKMGEGKYIVEVVVVVVVVVGEGDEEYRIRVKEMRRSQGRFMNRVILSSPSPYLPLPSPRKNKPLTSCPPHLNFMHGHLPRAKNHMAPKWPPNGPQKTQRPQPLSGANQSR